MYQCKYTAQIECCFRLFLPCISLQLIHQPTNELNKTQFMTHINLLLVSALACHPREIFPLIGIQAQHANPRIRHTKQNNENIKILKYINSISIKLRRYNFMLINFTPRNISEDPRPDLHRGRSLKAPKCNYIMFIVFFSKLPSAASLNFHRL
jgi:hypothetical protein